MDKDELWVYVLGKIKDDVSSVTFNNYFKNTSILSKDENKIVVFCKLGSVQKSYIERYYKDSIKNILKEKYNKIYEIVLLDNKEDLEIEKVESANKKYLQIEHKSYLNKTYTFDNFIIGKSNELSARCAMMVAEHPGENYNPFYLYGNSGVGKTHLMHAIGNYIEDHSDKRVLYVTTNTFIEDFTNMSRKIKDYSNDEEIERFKSKYRDIDVLIIDDIQSLSTTKTTQEEFFNTFNELHNKNKQIIVSSDSSPNDLKKLEERLKTRFGWKAVFNIDPPEYELRINIIKAKLKEKNVQIFDEDSINYIATNISGNVRSLEGAINRCLLYYNFYGKIDLESTIEALKDLINKGTGMKNDINRIQKIVADFYRLEVDDLKSKKRSSNILLPRQIAIYLCTKYTNENLSKIGIEFGQTHSTVINAKNKVEKMLKKDKNMRKVIKTLEDEIKKQT